MNLYYKTFDIVAIKPHFMKPFFMQAEGCVLKKNRVIEIVHNFFMQDKKTLNKNIEG